jgi:hypothetical protein
MPGWLAGGWSGFAKGQRGHSSRMDILAATHRFEDWRGGQVQLCLSDLTYKHAQMALRDDSFPFFRGTYYRWVQRWPKVCPELQTSPRVLAHCDGSRSGQHPRRQPRSS